MELLNRERLLKQIFYMCEQTEQGEKFQEAAYTIATVIQNAPTVNAAPVVKAKWIEHYAEKEPFFVCSKCGYLGKWFSGKTGYCPNCGAKME